MTYLIRYLSVVLVVVLFANNALAEFKFIITRGYDQPTSIAVVPFCLNGQQVMPENVAAIIGSDLSRTGQYMAMSPDNMLSQPCDHAQVYFRDWKLLKQDYLVIGNIDYDVLLKKYHLTYRLYDVVNGVNIHAARVSGTRDQVRDLAHLISDSVYEKLTGIKGVFSTKIAYVTVDSTDDSKTYRVEVSDADGHRPVELFKSPNAIISLAWSADGRKIGFTNFTEKGYTRIKIVDRLSKSIEELPAFPGINSGVAFSPDGNQLAFVNSKTGNADIYVLDLTTKKIRQITKHWSIDTEPSWSPDGTKLLFTSERGGRPQIYQVRLDTGRVERLTFEGVFNARAHYSSDGKYIVMVHQNGQGFHVGALEVENRQFRILTDTDLDESPSISPNGTMLVYGTKNNGRGVLAWASIDGELASIMPSVSGHVREPAWSPYLR